MCVSRMWKELSESIFFKKARNQLKRKIGKNLKQKFHKHMKRLSSSLIIMEIVLEPQANTFHASQLRKNGKILRQQPLPGSGSNGVLVATRNGVVSFTAE